MAVEKNDVDNLETKLVTFTIRLDAPSKPSRNQDNPFLKLLLDKPEIQQELVKYLPNETIHQLRSVTPELWNAFATNLLQISFNETWKDAQEQKMAHFLYESSLQLQNFVFENVKFVVEEYNQFIGNAPHFETFLDKYSATLKSLCLVKCEIKMSVFFQLIAHMDTFEELKLIECNPMQLFVVGFDIMNAVEYMDSAKRNLARLKHFVFRDIPPKELNKVGGMSTILGSTYQLESLNLLLYGPIQFPNQQFAKILRANGETLTRLALTSFTFEIELLELLWMIKFSKLALLSLLECTIDIGHPFGIFLGQLQWLKDLEFHHMILPTGCFSTVENLVQLKSIVFSCCKLGEDALQPFTKLISLETCHFAGDDACLPAVAAFLKNMSPDNLIHDLSFRNVSSSASDSFPDIANNFPNLISLDISGVTIQNKAAMSCIWKLEGLNQLMMAGCIFGYDPKEMDAEDLNANVPRIHNLKNLVCLDLSTTGVDDQMIHEELGCLNLLALNLSNTRVTFNGLKVLLKLIPSLESLDVKGCKLSNDEIISLSQSFDGQLAFDGCDIQSEFEIDPDELSYIS